MLLQPQVIYSRDASNGWGYFKELIEMDLKTTRRGFLRSLSMGGAFLAGGAVLAACGGGGAAAPKADAPPVTLDIGSKGDELVYDKTELSATAGSKITVNLKNNASAASGNKHNWILVKAGQVDAVAADGIAAGDAAGYVKAGDTRIIAQIGLIEAGKTGSITFDAPAAGTYDFICTFPGHNIGMKGKLVIK
jgi:azurin